MEALMSVDPVKPEPARPMLGLYSFQGPLSTVGADCTGENMGGDVTALFPEV